MLDITADLPSEILDAFYIDGRWLTTSQHERKAIVSPATADTIFLLPLASFSDVDLAINAASRAFRQGPWCTMSQSDRAKLMHRLADNLEEKFSLLAKLWTAQVGAPISLTSRLVSLASLRLRYFANLAESFEFQSERQTPRGLSKVIYDPVGPAALIIPWNAALPILMTKLGAALAAGCTCVIKTSPESPLDALVLAQCAHEAGFPAGVINVLTADAEQSAHLVASPDIDKVSFTGSLETGSKIASVVAARMGRLTMELGGKSAAILLEDAELERVLPVLEQYSMPFSGQFCFSQSRLIVPQSRAKEVTDAFASRIKSFRVGDPWDPSTVIGPVLNVRQFERVMSHIEQGMVDGARVITGGRRRTDLGPGFFIEPTLFADVSSQMSIAREEIFGPVVTLHTYETRDEAIEIANATDYGLSGTVFSNDTQAALLVARRLRTGQVGINGLELTPIVPFGGYKKSGFGREGGPEGVHAFLETKAILFPN